MLGALGLRNPSNASFDSLADRIDGLAAALAHRGHGLQFDPEPWVVLANRLRFRIDWKFNSPVEVLLRQGDYEPLETGFLLANVSRTGTFVDVGANLGWYSLHVAHQCPDASIHAIEALPATAADFRANLEMNVRTGMLSPDRIHLHEVALGDAPGEIYITQQHYASNYVTREQHPDSVAVPMRTLDDVLSGVQSIDFIKMDVEGFEHSVLEGATETLEANDPIVMLEIMDNHPGFEHRVDSKAADILGLMEGLGFAYGRFEDERGFVRQPAVRSASTGASYHNYVFARRLDRLKFPA